MENFKTIESLRTTSESEEVKILSGSAGVKQVNNSGGKQTFWAEGGNKNSEFPEQTEIKHGAAKTNASAET